MTRSRPRSARQRRPRWGSTTTFVRKPAVEVPPTARPMPHSDPTTCALSMGLIWQTLRGRQCGHARKHSLLVRFGPRAGAVTRAPSAPIMIAFVLGLVEAAVERDEVDRLHE